jgi:hypothetical protein
MFVKQFSVVMYGCACLLTLAIPKFTGAGMLTLHETPPRQPHYLVPDSRLLPLSTMHSIKTDTRQNRNDAHSLHLISTQ